MKKLFVLLIAVILVVAGTAAMVPGKTAPSLRNAALDAAFERSDLMLVEAEFPALTPKDFVYTDGMWEAMGIANPGDPIAVLSSDISGAAVNWLSLSPAGRSGLLAAGENIGLCYYDGKYRMLYPSHTRGVEDRYGNLERVFSQGIQRLLGEEGAVYSPDGRYAAIFNFEYTVATGHPFLDPIIIDLSTGEMFLTATYGNKPSDGERGAVSTAAFSADGRYFYYMLYGHTAEYRTVLYRYDLQGGTTELCYSGSDFNYYPNLAETGEGAFVILRDVMEKEGLTGLTSISYKDGAWTGKEMSFDLPSEYWHCNRLQFSPKSGYAFVLGSNEFIYGWHYAFQRIRPNDGFDGLNQYYVLSKESNRIEAYSAGEIRELVDNWKNGSPKANAGTFALDMPFQTILSSRLSPDGQYALLHTLNAGTRDNFVESKHLYLVRLKDLAVKEVQGIDPEDIRIGTLANGFKPMIEWNTDTLIIGTNGGIQAYRFK